MFAEAFGRAGKAASTYAGRAEVAANVSGLGSAGGSMLAGVETIFFNTEPITTL
ncbi:hypothetical protein VDG1235_756 [Verrucomicrobiia bacterium DG1235]|nr:hypothetical protein VDG1235_756 [Verrucomicrobiae bacterium DG1235]